MGASSGLFGFRVYSRVILLPGKHRLRDCASDWLLVTFQTPGRIQKIDPLMGVPIKYPW